MKEYTTEFIRNIALVSHSSAGKTMLAEAFLHFTGATTRLGRIEDGSSISDFEDEEIRRGISLSTGLIPVEFKEEEQGVLCENDIYFSSDSKGTGCTYEPARQGRR